MHHTGWSHLMPSYWNADGEIWHQVRPPDTQRPIEANFAGRYGLKPWSQQAVGQMPDAFSPGSLPYCCL